MNSGNTQPFPHPRGRATFLPIPDYPYAQWRKKRRRGERVVELCVEGGVRDVKKHVIEVRRMIGADLVELIHVKMGG